MGMRRKVRYVADAPDSGGHDCHWPGCTKQVKPALWGCPQHWFTLPPSIRSAIWSAYRPGQEIYKNPSEQYLRAARRAQDWIAKNYPETTTSPEPKPRES